jgi:hypothetical protein
LNNYFVHQESQARHWAQQLQEVQQFVLEDFLIPASSRQKNLGDKNKVKV